MLLDLFNALFFPLIELFGEIGIGDTLISLGTGNVTWFTMSLENLVITIFGIIINVVIAVFVLKFFLLPFRILNNYDGGKR